MWDTIGKAVVAVVAAGGGIWLILWLAMKTFGEKWLNSQFAKRLAEFQHAKDVEMENVRYRINSIFDRAVRLHQAEFEVAPEMWSRAKTAYDRARILTSRGQTFEDVGRMNGPQLEDFLKHSPLREWQKDELRASSKRQEYYVNAIFFHRANETRDAYYDFARYHSTKGVFLAPELDQKFGVIRDLIFDAITEKDFTEELRRMGANPGPEGFKKMEALFGAESSVAELRALVGGLLRDSKSTKTSSASEHVPT